MSIDGGIAWQGWLNLILITFLCYGTSQWLIQYSNKFSFLIIIPIWLFLTTTTVMPYRWLG